MGGAGLCRIHAGLWMVHEGFGWPIKEAVTGEPISACPSFWTRQFCRAPARQSPRVQTGRRSVLGASGFVNITCIEAADGTGHYIEADMRPNAWADFSRLFREDAAPRIRDWFGSRIRLTKASAARIGAGQAPLTIPYFLRLGCWELLTNRYAVWQFIPFADARLVRRLLLVKFMSFVVATEIMSSVLLKIKWLVPSKLRNIARGRLTALTDGL